LWKFTRHKHSLTWQWHASVIFTNTCHFY